MKTSDGLVNMANAILPEKLISYDVTVAGYISVDLTPAWHERLCFSSFSELLQPGHLIEMAEMEITPGGAVANTGLALQRFRRVVYLNGLVGYDLLGDFIIRHLQRQGVAEGIRQTDRAATAYGVVIAPPGLDRIFLEHVGCNAVFGTEDIDWLAVEKSRIFHFGYPPLMPCLYSDGGIELSSIFRRVQEVETIVSLDMTLPDAGSPAGRIDWPAFMEQVLPAVDIFVPSIEELLYTMRPDRYAQLQADYGSHDILEAIPLSWYSELGDKIIGLGVKVLMITAGSRGAYLQTGDIDNWKAAAKLKLKSGNWSRRRLWASAMPVDLRRQINATGAGDCAVAGLLAGLLEGMRIEEAAGCAMLAGRDNLYGLDALSGLPDWPGIIAELEAVKGIFVFETEKDFGKEEY